jgi:hypothetical protein
MVRGGPDGTVDAGACWFAYADAPRLPRLDSSLGERQYQHFRRQNAPPHVDDCCDAAKTLIAIRNETILNRGAGCRREHAPKS